MQRAVKYRIFLGLVAHREWVFNKQNTSHDNGTAHKHCAKGLQIMCGWLGEIAILKSRTVLLLMQVPKTIETG